MFISSDFLSINYSVDDKIAKFFVDREPPPNNLYWHKKLLYLRPGAGYIFIPLIVDLLYKIGIDREQLLSKHFIDTMEQVGHISALEEIKEINAETAIKKCIELTGNNCISQDWLNFILPYFKQEEHDEVAKLASPFKALHRGDVFLFSICQLTFPSSLNESIIQQWFALITTLLLVDDADDLESDLKAGEENAFIESGLNGEGLEKIDQLVDRNIETISKINKSMARRLLADYKEVINRPAILALKN